MQYVLSLLHNIANHQDGYMNKKKTIAIDMDNVLVDIESNWIDLYEKAYGVRIEKESLRGVPEHEAFPEPAKAWELIHKPGFFRHAPMMKGAREAVESLSKDYEIYIVSAATEFPNSLLEKWEWIAEHLPFISWRHIVLCGDKSVINTDYMIDDHLKNLDFHKGTPVLFTASHNINVLQYTRVNNWEEVVTLFESFLVSE